MRKWMKLPVVGLACGVLLLGFGTPAAAQAEPIMGETSSTIPLKWDGPTTNVAWDGTEYGTSEGTFIGSPVTVPGDRVSRQAFIVNDGPADATATVEIRDVTTAKADGTLNADLENVIHLFWDINGRQGDEVWRELRVGRDADGASYAVSFPIARGAQFPMTVGYYFPADVTTGRDMGKTSVALSFKVKVFLQEKKVGTGGHTVSPNWLLMGGALLAMIIGGLIVWRRRSE